MMIYTRKGSDRTAVFVSLVPFLVVWLVSKAAHFLTSSVFFSNYWYNYSAFGPAELTGYTLILATCVGMYAWTRNRIVSLTPWVTTIALTMWPIFRDTVQTALWKATDNSIFWGHSYPDPLGLGAPMLTFVARLFVLAIYLYICKKIDGIGVKNPRAV
jgi:hypothetical protein